MRPIILIALMMSLTALKAQTFLPVNFTDDSYRRTLSDIFYLNGSSKKIWSFSKYSVISSSFTSFKGGYATIVSAPVGLQLNRRLNNNLYAFAGVSLAPAYINLRHSFMDTDFNKTAGNNSYFKSGSLGLYSRAELGLQYINDEKTFSISGSIGIERSSYPTLPYGRMNNTMRNGPQ